MPFIVDKQPDESYSDAVRRIAGGYGLETECLESYEKNIQTGLSPADAAWNALYAWDVLPYVAPKPRKPAPESLPESAPTSKPEEV